ncbi:MAG: hypothetical protein S4CHLAM107_10380 [Chlamydiia bacterium]|nr:hypothetical protein [Chlamydiia bacterium]
MSVTGGVPLVGGQVTFGTSPATTPVAHDFKTASWSFSVATADPLADFSFSIFVISV